VRADIGATLTATDDKSTLRVTLRARPVDHLCGQLRIEDPGADDDGAELELDYAARASGEAVRRA
jgi:hypothetical protein